MLILILDQISFRPNELSYRKTSDFRSKRFRSNRLWSNRFRSNRSLRFNMYTDGATTMSCCELGLVARMKQAVPHIVATQYMIHLESLAAKGRMKILKTLFPYVL
ncbi:hypothetical protein RF11_12448 [Thelohanellus kitauei]|uniref:Uncharacterized protein n=1 Tax=Thelohanellus kitauei TaxID=669202 RepID=A0A0C2JQW8_THEKT|nr:hypothetical protein RF11_12448 [Thelohanellus kitauei]